MFEAQRNGMQRKPLRHPSVMHCFFPAIPAIAEHGMAMVGKMNANLIATPGFQLYLDDGRIPQFLENSIVSDCELALAFFSSGKLIQIVAGFQIGAERASRWFQDSGDDGNV